MNRLKLETNLIEGAENSLFFLSFNNISLKVCNKIILENETVSFTYSRIVLVKGAVGSGKTTILKMIAGLSDFIGEILHQNSNQENVKCVFLHSAAEFNFITGYIDDELTLTGIDKSKFEAYKGRSVYDMSGGELKKLSILMALEGRGEEVILMDEPLDMLDDIEAQNMAELIIEYSKKRPFIMATHDCHFDHVADVIINLI